VTYVGDVAKVNKPFLLDVKYQYDAGPAGIDVDELVEAFGPDGVLRKSLKAKAHLEMGKQHVHSFRGLARKAGTYKLKVTVSGTNCYTWVDESSFTVEEDPGHASNTQPPVISPTTAAAEARDVGIGEERDRPCCSDGRRALRNVVRIGRRELLRSHLRRQAALRRETTARPSLGSLPRRS